MLFYIKTAAVSALWITLSQNVNSFFESFLSVCF